MGSTFAAQFMRGLQAGNEEKRRKAEEEQRAAHLKFSENMQTQQFDLTKFNAALQAAIQQAAAQQGKVSESTSAGPGISAPTAAEAASPGTGLQPAAGGILDFLRPNAGAPQPPAMERIEPSPVRVTPSASQKALGMQELLIPILSKQQVERDTAAQADTKLQQAIAQAKALAGIESEAGSFTISNKQEADFYGRPIGSKVSAVEQNSAKAVQADDRQRDIARESREGRRADAKARTDEKRSAMDVTVDAYVAAAQEGKITREALSQAGKEVAARVQTALQKSGTKLLNNKEQTYKTELDDLSSLTGQIKTLYDPSYVGWADSKYPDFLVRDPKLATFRAKAQAMFNQYAKARSGAAVTMPEELRLTRELPSPGDNEVVFNAKLDAVIEEIEEKRNRLLGIKGEDPGGGPGGASRPPTIEELRKRWKY